MHRRLHDFFLFTQVTNGTLGLCKLNIKHIKDDILLQSTLKY
jgi:hypothetical protein